MQLPSSALTEVPELSLGGGRGALKEQPGPVARTAARELSLQEDREAPVEHPAPIASTGVRDSSLLEDRETSRELTTLSWSTVKYCGGPQLLVEETE